MSRCASGSSSSSTSGRRARQAASATSLRWPPESSLVGIASAAPSMPERAQVAERLALGAVAAGVGPAREQPLVVGERAGHRVEVGGQRRVGEPRLGRVQLGLERGQLRPGGAARWRSGVALVAVDDLRQDGRARARGGSVTVAGVGVLEPGEDPQQRRLAAAVGAEDADPRAGLDVEVGAARIERPPKDFVEAARGELGDAWPSFASVAARRRADNRGSRTG